MRDVLMWMLREEWRMHTLMFGSIMFAMFPLMIAIFSCAATLFLPMFSAAVGTRILVTMAHYSLAIFGISVGAFGLLGRDVMTRRFGEASLLIRSVHHLPISARYMLLAFFIKDVLYYLFLWIVPMLLGFGIASLILSFPVASVLMLFISLTLAFLTGLSIAFFLSTLYIRSSRYAAIVIAGGAITGMLLSRTMNLAMLELFPPLHFFVHHAVWSLCASCGMVVILSACAVLLFRSEYTSGRKRYANTFEGIAARIPWSSYAPFVAKDLLDLQRSEGGVGKLLFSFFIPAAIVYMLFAVMEIFSRSFNVLVQFSLFLGVISSSIYNWLTEYDSFEFYAFLPVKVSTVLRGKAVSYALITAVALAVLVPAALISGDGTDLLPALCAFVAFSFYSLSVTVLLTGLHPNIFLYNPKIFLLYFLLIGPALLLFFFLALVHPLLLCATLILLIPSHVLLMKAAASWDMWYYSAHKKPFER